MQNGLGRTILSTLAVVCLISGSLAIDNLRVVYQWKQMDYEWPNNQTKQLFPYYKQEDNLPWGLEVAGNRLFITVPRWKPGVAATLNYIMLNDSRQSPPLIPYPSWEAHQSKPGGKLPDIVSAFRIRADRCRRLWVLDTGLSNITGTLESQKPPTLIIYDLSNDSILRNYTIPESQRSTDSLFANIAVEDKSCTESYGYLADLIGFGIIVYSWNLNRSWHVFYPDPQNDELDISRNPFHLNCERFGMALQPTGDGYSTLYLHPIRSTKEYSVSTKFLRNERLANNSEAASQFKEVGSRDNNGQSSVTFSFDRKTGILLYALVNLNAIACWRTGSVYDIQNHDFFEMSNSEIMFLNDLKIDPNGNIWVLSKRIRKCMHSRLDPEDYNFRFLTGSLKEAVQGTVGASDAPNQPPQVMTSNRSGYGRSGGGYEEEKSGSGRPFCSFASVLALPIYNFLFLTGSLKEAVQGTVGASDAPNQPPQVMTSNRSGYGRSGGGYEEEKSGSGRPFCSFASVLALPIYNFLFLTGSLKEAVQGTVGASDAPNQPPQVMTSNRSGYGRSGGGYEEEKSGSGRPFCSFASVLALPVVIKTFI